MQFKKDERSEIKSTSHSRYRCQYHIVFAPKYRRKEIYGKLKKDIGKTLRTLCKQKNVEILEAEACIDHIHMLVSIPPYLSVVQFMGYLKEKKQLNDIRPRTVHPFQGLCKDRTTAYLEGL